PKVSCPKTPDSRDYPGLAQGVDPRKLAVQARIVEPVTDHEPVGDDEAGEVDLDRELAPRGPVQQCGHPQGGRLKAAKASEDGVDRAAGVDDVLDQAHAAAF